MNFAIWDSGLPQAVLTARVIFLVLLPVILFGRPRWALLAWLLTANLDLTGPSTTVNSSVGWMNVVKSLGLPIYLWFRLRGTPSTVWRTPPALFWLALVAYAGVATLWSAYPLAAVKMIGHMAGIVLILVVLEKFARRQVLDVTVWRWLIVISIAMAVFQTHVIGGLTYGFDGPDQAVRLTSFVGAQHFAALLVAFLAVTLWLDRLPTWSRWTLVACLLVCIFLNGSRTWFLGALFVLTAYVRFEYRRVIGPAAVGAAGIVMTVLAAGNLGLLEPDRYVNTDSRIIATLNALLAGQDTPGKAGLRNIGFRAKIYRGLYEELSDADVSEVVFGHGTSNGAKIAKLVLPRRQRLDPNRVVHNEWFRVLYEWGVVGLLLWLMSFMSLLAAVLMSRRRSRNTRMNTALLSYLPGFILALSTENAFAGAGMAMTVGLSALLADAVYSPGRGAEQALPRQEVAEGDFERCEGLGVVLRCS